MVLLIAQCGSDGLASHVVLFTLPGSVQKLKAKCKTKKSSVPREFLHIKSSTRIVCWNVRMLGTLSDQSAQHLAGIKTMNEKMLLKNALANVSQREPSL